VVAGLRHVVVMGMWNLLDGARMILSISVAEKTLEDWSS
jgi:hypothetical protein